MIKQWGSRFHRRVVVGVQVQVCWVRVSYRRAKRTGRFGRAGREFHLRMPTPTLPYVFINRFCGKPARLRIQIRNERKIWGLSGISWGFRTSECRVTVRCRTFGVSRRSSPWSYERTATLPDEIGFRRPYIIFHYYLPM